MGQAPSASLREAVDALCCASWQEGRLEEAAMASAESRPMSMMATRTRVSAPGRVITDGMGALGSSHGLRTNGSIAPRKVTMAPTVSDSGGGRIRATSSEPWRPASKEKPRAMPHLVIHFDVNKTVIMKDSISKKTVDDIVNEIISDAAWGREVDGEWHLESKEPSVTRPHGSEHLVSYVEYLEKKVTDKKLRNKLTGKFTSKGEPGEALAEHAQRLRKGLRNPDGTDVRVIHAFFEILVYLKRMGRSFTIVFRTFGEDLGEVAEELNAFCEGRHPRNPGLKFDGSDGEPDYRLPVDDLDRIGTFHRDDSCTSLIMGTWEQPGEGRYKHAEDRSVSFYDSWPHVKITKGITEVVHKLEELCARPGTLGLRDYFQYWKAHGRSSKGGKVFFVDRHLKLDVHNVFFDDNIRIADAFIVQPLSKHEPSRQLWPVPLLRTHMCRAEPLESIPDKMYFINHLHRLETGLERAISSQKRLRTVFHKIRVKGMTVRQLLKDFRVRASPLPQAELNLWEDIKRRESDLSMTELRTLEQVELSEVMMSMTLDAEALPLRPHSESRFCDTSCGTSELLSSLSTDKCIPEINVGLPSIQEDRELLDSRELLQAA